MASDVFLQDEDETDSPANRNQMSEQLITQFENRVSTFENSPGFAPRLKKNLWPQGDDMTPHPVQRSF